MPNKVPTTFKTELFSKLVANQPLTSATEGSITNVKIHNKTLWNKVKQFGLVKIY